TAHFMPVCMVLDKMGKITRDQMTEMLVSEGLNSSEILTVFELMAISSVDDAAAKVAADSKNIADLRDLFSMLADSGLADYLKFDISIIRGLSYYTGIVFEAFDTQNQFRAIFGGGRYDNLLSSLGGEKMPCVGLGFGDVVVRELLAARNKLKDTEAVDGFIIGYWSDNERSFSTQIAAAIRQQGQRVDLALKAEKAKKLFSRGNKVRAAYAIYIGPDEVANGAFSVKNMQTRDSVDVTIDDIRNNKVIL
ncbi:ATP phosphoribosyltransferase regulatory subunit, partial [bacterium]|nr:ATP phosphoribosyltransferase regulatory subunit [bacterium]